MQEAYVGSWAKESHLSIQHLNSIRALNFRFLGWAAVDRGSGTAPFAQQLARLSEAQRAAAANCPYALFDLRFEDAAHWQLRLQNAAAWQIADDAPLDRDTLDFARLALFYVWHVASGAGRAAHLLHGMRSETVDEFRRISVEKLPALAASEAANLCARWSDCGAYWRALINAAARSNAAALKRVQLSGLQLTVAAQFSSA